MMAQIEGSSACAWTRASITPAPRSSGRRVADPAVGRPGARAELRRRDYRHDHFANDHVLGLRQYLDLIYHARDIFRLEATTATRVRLGPPGDPDAVVQPVRARERLVVRHLGAEPGGFTRVEVLAQLGRPALRRPLVDREAWVYRAHWAATSFEPGNEPERMWTRFAAARRPAYDLQAVTIFLTKDMPDDHSRRRDPRPPAVPRARADAGPDPDPASDPGPGPAGPVAPAPPAPARPDHALAGRSPPSPASPAARCCSRCNGSDLLTAAAIVLGGIAFVLVLADGLLCGRTLRRPRTGRS